jgi:DNA-binding NarL/FixJ family response regulator
VWPAPGHLEQLPPPQATALRAALGLADGTRQERFLVFAACLSLLSELAERRPVLCLVDDAQWLDEASADALRFVARRLDAEGIVIVFAARDGELRSFDAGGLPSLQLTGLDATAAASLLGHGAGVDAAPAARDRLVEQTRGNALALVELPSAPTQGQLAGQEPPPEVLPMTQQLERAFLARAQQLPEETRRFLIVTAADDSGDLGIVTRAAVHLSTGSRRRSVPGAQERRRESATPSTLSQSTPQELQVAKYVAEGLSNKEVAAQLFLSPRTIDAHLRSVFAKLEITSRTQLARLSLGGARAAFVAAAFAAAV